MSPGLFDITDLAPLPSVGVMAVVGGMLAVQFAPRRLALEAKAGFSSLAPVLQGALLAVGFVCIDALGPVGVAPFIYFQF